MQTASYVVFINCPLLFCCNYCDSYIKGEMGRGGEAAQLSVGSAEGECMGTELCAEDVAPLQCCNITSVLIKLRPT